MRRKAIKKNAEKRLRKTKKNVRNTEYNKEKKKKEKDDEFCYRKIGKIVWYPNLIRFI